MDILGINLSHNGSYCVVRDGATIFYLEEERINRIKHSKISKETLLKISKSFDISYIVLTGITQDHKFIHTNNWNETLQQINKTISSVFPKIKIYDYFTPHHLTHALTAWHNSIFEQCLALVIDGNGSLSYFKNNPQHPILETESIFDFIKTIKPRPLYKSYYSKSGFESLNDNISNKLTLGLFWQALSCHYGWNWTDAGKVMGLSSYGKPNPNIPPIIKDGRINPEIATLKPSENILDVLNIPLSKDPQKWHHDPSQVTDLEKDLAYAVQTESQKYVGDLIEKYILPHTTKNVICSGGYFLNCVSNKYLLERFPQLNFYFEPISHDGGTCIGAAKHLYHSLVPNDDVFYAQDSIYYGPPYQKNKVIEQIKTYQSMFTQHKTTPEQIAKLISEKNIVCIFQGRSEAGPRALGNRSILYDPTDPNGKDFVNKVKKREWFRPFAGTVLQEKANEWFSMHFLKESPFMMYALDVWENKRSKIPAITHVDGTCRIQTLTEEQNPHYYKLIQEFEKITGVPILFNTSFNLAGDPLVETIEDALETLLKSELKYLYLPELEILLEKK